MDLTFLVPDYPGCPGKEAICHKEHSSSEADMDKLTCINSAHNVNWVRSLGPVR